MEEKLTSEELEKVTGGTSNDTRPRPDENIHAGDRFQNYIQVYEVVRFVKRGSSRNYDLFECKFWGSYGAFTNGWEADSIDTYYRIQLETKERI